VRSSDPTGRQDLLSTVQNRHFLFYSNGHPAVILSRTLEAGERGGDATLRSGKSDTEVGVLYCSSRKHLPHVAWDNEIINVPIMIHSLLELMHLITLYD
jgi:hypothetical protein